MLYRVLVITALAGLSLVLGCEKKDDGATKPTQTTQKKKVTKKKVSKKKS